MYGPVLFQVTVTQLPIEEEGVPPVIIQFTVFEVGLAQYDTEEPGQIMVSPVIAGAAGEATTFTGSMAESEQVLLGFKGIAVIKKLPVNPFQLIDTELEGPGA
jgi:hypothetical protein